MQGLQVDGGFATPPNEPEGNYFETVYISQVDGADEDGEGEDGSEPQMANPSQGISCQIALKLCY